MDGEPGRLQSMGSLRVGHYWATSLSLFTFMHWRRKWQPTPIFLPGEFQGWGSLVGCHLWGRTVGDDWNDLAAAAAVVSHCGFKFHFPNDWICERLFICFFIICVFSLEKWHSNLLSIFCLGSLSYYWVVRNIYIFWVQVPYQTYNLQSIFPLSLWIVFSIFLMVPFEAQRILILMKSQFTSFFFYGLCFWFVSENPLPNSRSQRFSPVFSHKVCII